MNEAVKNQVIAKFEKELTQVNDTLERNKREINKISERQQVLKRLKQDLARLINTIKGY